MNIKEYVNKMCVASKASSEIISCLSESKKNAILKSLIDEIENNKNNIIEANNKDLEIIKSSENFANSFVDRLMI